MTQTDTDLVTDEVPLLVIVILPQYIGLVRG